MTPRVTLAEFKALQKKAAERKEKRAAKAVELWGPKPKKRRRPSARTRAFRRLIDLRDKFVRLRGKYRTGGRCEVAMNCGGIGLIEVVYHGFPAALGNAIKHHPLNLLAACSHCNGSEYFARKRGADHPFKERFRLLVGDATYSELDAMKGRKHISTAEAIEKGDQYKAWIESGAWRIS